MNLCRFAASVLTALAVAACSAGLSVAQPLLPLAPNNAEAIGNRNQNNASDRNAGNARGGAAQADFDTLIDLIVATIEPDTWDDVGGNGSIQGFPGGVYVDAQGIMKTIDPGTRSLLAKRIQKWNQSADFENDDFSRRSPARKVSLARLDRAIRARSLRGEGPTPSMRYLAGLEQIDYVVFDLLAEDVLLVGPADRWIRADDGRIVARSSRRPILQLDDFVVLLRNASQANGQFMCSITPTQEGIRSFQEFVEVSTRRSIPVGGRRAWVDGLRESLGHQTIDVEGVPADTRVARVIVEADYHMKRIGIGLEPGTDGVTSYLDSIEILKGQAPPKLGVLRWWFTLNDVALPVSEDGSTVDMTLPMVQVLSENEMLTKRGGRIHTGRSDELNRRFAGSFTKHFDSLARRYPVYADLENIFELAVVAALIRDQQRSNRLNGILSELLDAGSYAVTTARVPQRVPSIINYRVINGRHVVCAVSGGVQFSGTVATAKNGPLKSSTLETAVPATSGSPWWWD